MLITMRQSYINMTLDDRTAREIRRESVANRVDEQEMMEAYTEPRLQMPQESCFRTTVPKVVASNLGLSEGMTPTVLFDQSGLIVFDFRDELTEVATDGGE